MPSKEGEKYFKIATRVSKELAKITIINPWSTRGGSSKDIDEEEQKEQALEKHKHTMGSIFATINALKEQPEKTIPTATKEEWLAQGKKTIGAQQGVCSDCAAACAVQFLKYETAPTVEIISTGEHAMTLINRKKDSDVKDASTWGEDCIVVDIWDQNQSGIPAAVYATDTKSPTMEYIIEKQKKLVINVVLND